MGSLERLGSGAVLAWLGLALLFRVARPRVHDAPAATYRRLQAALLLASACLVVPFLRAWLPGVLRLFSPVQVSVQLLATADGAEPLGLGRGLYVSPFAILGGGWLLSTSFACLRLLVARLRLERLLRRAPPAPAPLQGRCGSLARELGARRPRLLLSSEAHAPFSVGVVRPTVVLPPAVVAGLSGDQLELVLRHELIHVRRLDPLSHALAQVAAAVFSFHPLLPQLLRELRTAREAAVDLELSALGPRAYADLLLELAARLRFGHIPAHVSMDDTALARRIAMLTSPTRNLESPTLSAVLVAAGTIAAVGLLSPRVFAEGDGQNAAPRHGPFERPLKDHDPLAAHQGDIDSCYALARAEDDDLVIDALARFEVDAESYRVTSAEVPTPQSQIFEHCLEAKALESWTFAPLPDMPAPPRDAKLVVAVTIQRQP